MKGKVAAVASLLLGLTALMGLAAVAIDRGYSPFSKNYYLTDRQALFVRPGLKIEVTGADVAPDRTVSVTFSVADDRGLPLDIAGVTTPGPIDARFILAHIPRGQTQYVAYTTVTVTSPTTGVTAVQAAADARGRIEKISEGTYRYIFGTRLPENFDSSATHSIGIFATRNLTEFGLEREVANKVVHFVPPGGAVRDVVRTSACNQCHDPLQAHGGARRDVELCVLCHTPQTTDPDTGNTVDFKVMIHKIHRGRDLPSVRSGGRYQIVGFGQRAFDFSTVGFPQDLRNCETCHAKEATQQEAYLLRPSRAACGACHDDVNFATGQNHAGGPQISDRLCATCHIPEGELEFDASITGAHTVPHKSRQLEGINVDLLEVVNARPGQRPTVRFTLKNNAGQPILPSDLPSFSIVMAGPTTDYRTRIVESARTDSVSLQNGFTYTFKSAIPADATGSFVVGAEGNRNVKLNRGTTKEIDVREAMQTHPLLYFAVTDPEPKARRTIVADTKCDTCHENLAAHGLNRHDPAYCVLCHQAAASDAARRPADKLPAQTIDFKFLVHRIHMGERLTRDFTVYGFGGTPFTVNEVRFPGDQRNCEKCHVGSSFEVPVKGILPTVAPREFFSPIPPNSAACLACHDSLEAAAHAFTNTAPFGEACAACHGAGAEFEVARVHAR